MVKIRDSIKVLQAIILREILTNIFIRRLQKSWKQYAYRLAPSLGKGQLSWEREKRRMKIKFALKGVLFHPFAEQRSKKLIATFFKEMFRNQGLKTRIFQFRVRIVSIQRKCLLYFKNKELRLQIIKTVFNKEVNRLLVHYSKKKKHKEEKQLRNLKPASVEAVINRYLRYTLDQYVMT